MNTELLQLIKEAILGHPEQFAMGEPYSDFHENGITVTAASIPGWYHHLSAGANTLAESRKLLLAESALVAAQEGLDLPNDRLFSTSSWPEGIKTLYETYVIDGDRAGAAFVAASAINSYIRTGGWPNL